MDFLRDLKEGSEDRAHARKLFRRMDKMQNELEQMYEDLHKGLTGQMMKDRGYGKGELTGLLDGLNKTLTEFEDFMPGLEMEMRGED